jgi:hypothetical protein
MVVCAATRSVDHKSCKHGAKERWWLCSCMDHLLIVTPHLGVELLRHSTRSARRKESSYIGAEERRRE